MNQQSVARSSYNLFMFIALLETSIRITKVRPVAAVTYGCSLNCQECEANMIHQSVARSSHDLFMFIEVLETCIKSE